ncbi:macrocin-O-methyltransferase [Candidatus Rhodobacter oscarellae]|uniref:Macrocin-O-methyltransferase n=1 Tax=Candidatus Rhodobacter oscarellae TaxID=1675527 RepID=A0A0J9E740_9RHOB|nr:TylF/MycF/NovP-related O-methyltransferase [Candidatus Rhodobacter lobularis]KMW58585.1 macrocin-O-methyltransferase [Candidatus Rhodobacter lobularis]
MYLDLLKRCLLNEMYLDDELRLLYLRACLSGEETFDFATYHDIRAALPEQFEKLRAARSIGQFMDRNIRNSGFSHTMIGRARLNGLHVCLDKIIGDGIPGDLMECGVWRGGACIFMAGYLRDHGIGGRKVILADSFEGLPVSQKEPDKGLQLDKSAYPELAVSLDEVKANFAAYGLLEAHIHFLKIP